MTLPYKGSARFPGPLGTSPATLGGRLPGPLGFRQVDLAKGGATKALKTLKMPPPWTSSTPIRVRKVDWKLSNKDEPVTSDVKQGALPNCPVASILAALAHTSIGQKHLNEMVTEYIGTPVKTTLSDPIMTTLSSGTADDPDYHPQDKEISSKRYFTVNISMVKVPDTTVKVSKEEVHDTIMKASTEEVHDTFYVKYTDGDDIDLVFMDSPNYVLWPSVIEKACALRFGSYKELGNYKKHKVNEFWEILMGSAPQGFTVTDATDIEKIREAAKAAPRVPTIGATREPPIKMTGLTLTPMHGYAVLGMQDSTIELYDPAKTKKFTISLEDFRDNFQAVYYGNP